MYRQHQAGKTYPEIANLQGLSKECVRYWCRRQRDGGSAESKSPTQRMLARFDAKVRYVILRLRKEHPRWGPGRIHFHLTRRPSLSGLGLPSRAQIGRYVQQWPKLRRPPKLRAASPDPGCAIRVHQRWQIDFKVHIALADTEGQLFTATDERSGACVGGRLFATPGARPKLAEVVAFLRTCFTTWGGLPEEIQTDGEAILVGRAGEAYFPSRFTLWLAGLGITHVVIPSRQPTYNAEVERCHRTLQDYALLQRKKPTLAQANQLLEQARQDLVFSLPSQGKACQGRPPASTYPALLDPRRPYHADLEPELFSLERVDAFLAAKTWSCRVGKMGQVTIGEQRRYTLSRKLAGQQVLVRFDPTDRHFVFFTLDVRTQAPIQEIGRKPARGVEQADLRMRSERPLIQPPLQLPLPLRWPPGVSAHEQLGV
jgi:transposase InsO family protein